MMGAMNRLLAACEAQARGDAGAVERVSRQLGESGEIWDELFAGVGVCLKTAVPYAVAAPFFGLTVRMVELAIPGLDDQRRRQFMSGSTAMGMRAAELAPDAERRGQVDLKLGTHLMEMGKLMGNGEFVQLSMQFFDSSRKGLVRGTTLWAGSQLNEAMGRLELAGRGVTPKENAQEAIRLCQRSTLEGFGMGEPFRGVALLNEGIGYKRLAELGVAIESSLKEAVERFARAREEGLARGGKEWVEACFEEGLCRGHLGLLQVDMARNIARGAELMAEARQGIQPGDPLWATSLVNEAGTRLGLGQLGIEAKFQFGEVVRLCRQARAEGLVPGEVQWGVTVEMEAEAQAGLV
jgi:hypothetical protein